tara:strand:+ start:11007 stop:11171 length:165 start_codon:yes stop_codon:yes gene_type:complete
MSDDPERRLLKPKRGWRTFLAASLPVSIVQVQKHPAPALWEHGFDINHEIVPHW